MGLDQNFRHSLCGGTLVKENKLYKGSLALFVPYIYVHHCYGVNEVG